MLIAIGVDLISGISLLKTNVAHNPIIEIPTNIEYVAANFISFMIYSLLPLLDINEYI